MTQPRPTMPSHSHTALLDRHAAREDQARSQSLAWAAAIIAMGAVGALVAVTAAMWVLAMAQPATTVPTLSTGAGVLVGPGYVDSFTVTCATTATLIQAPSGSQFAYECQVDDAAGADIAVGDSGLTTATAPLYGPGEFVGGNVRQEYCRVAASTETLRCRALVTTAQ